MSSVNIEERTLSKHKVTWKKKDGTMGESEQYRITLPSSFGKEHETDKVYVIADSIGMFVPDVETLMQVMIDFPKIRERVLDKSRDTELIKLFQLWDSLNDDKKKAAQTLLKKILSEVVDKEKDPE